MRLRLWDITAKQFMSLVNVVSALVIDMTDSCSVNFSLIVGSFSLFAVFYNIFGIYVRKVIPCAWWPPIFCLLCLAIYLEIVVVSSTQTCFYYLYSMKREKLKLMRTWYFQMVFLWSCCNSAAWINKKIRRILLLKTIGIS